jgi:hypothetical protein
MRRRCTNVTKYPKATIFMSMLYPVHVSEYFSGFCLQMAFYYSLTVIEIICQDTLMMKVIHFLLQSLRVSKNNTRSIIASINQSVHEVNMETDD